MYCWDFVGRVGRAGGDRTEVEKVWVIGKDMGLGLASLVEWGFWLEGARVPNLTRQKVKYSIMTRYYCIDKARVRLGYVPKWGMEEAVRRTVAWFREREGKEKGQ